VTLSDEAIREFQDLHEQKFGSKPTSEEAERDLVLLMRIVIAIHAEKSYETGAA
jgi:hypothetical protein